MLPFDLHVLGLPPAFTLSQDQTLHLNFSDRGPNALSAVVVTSSKLLTAFACFELTWFCYERLQDGQPSTCQTPAQVTCAHCQRTPEWASAPHPFCLFPVAAEASEGAAHYRVVFVAVNTLLRFFFLPVSAFAVAEKVSHSDWFRRFRQHPSFVRPSCRSAVASGRAAHYREASEAVNPLFATAFSASETVGFLGEGREL